jgi:hypothetical protein
MCFEATVTDTQAGLKLACGGSAERKKNLDLSFLTENRTHQTTGE